MSSIIKQKLLKSDLGMKSKVNPEKVLHLYRAILRSARGMPTERRIQYIKKKARDEFEEGRKVSDSAQIEFLFNYGEVQLETIRVQSKSFSDLICNPHYVNTNGI